MAEPLDWSGGAPRSPRFDDIYFSPQDGLAETGAVFLEGCGLPEGWRGRDHFVVGELGFGTGLNILALLQLWAATREPGARLHVFSVEAHLMAREDAERALARWPELEPFAGALIAAWPDGRPGFHRIDLPEGVILDLFIGEAGEGLEAWDGAANAWFLDGFAPSRNPQMWRPELLALLAKRSAVGARAASFTVAGAVRRGLEAAGFEVAKRPGYGAKRERLEAHLTAAEPAEGLALRPTVPRIVILGAGIAGASLVRAFRRLGATDVTVVESISAGAGASGAPAALVLPRLDAGGGDAAWLHAQAFDRAVGLYRREAPTSVIAEGALQLESQERDAGRFGRIADWAGFAPGAVQRLKPDAAARALDEAASKGALEFAAALVVEPVGILDPWLDGAQISRAEVIRLERAGEAWRLVGRGDETIALADILCLAAGPHSARLADLPLRGVRGQLSWSETVPFTGAAASWGGYAVPLRQGVLFGATHDRDDWSLDLRPGDDRRNLAALADVRPALADRIKREDLKSRAALRAATPDHQPLAGRVPRTEGLFVLSGLGGRGFTLAPLLAEHVAAIALGAPSPLPRPLASCVDPARVGRRNRSGSSAVQEDGSSLTPPPSQRSSP